MFASLTSYGIRFPRSAGFILAAAAWAFFPTIAKAECGDYVHVSGLFAKTDSLPKPEHRVPCHGPNCKKLPDRAPLLPVTAPTVSVEEVACLTADAIVPEAGGGKRAAYSDQFPGESHTSRLERPPRA